MTFRQYLARVVNDRRVRIGQERMREHRALLQAVSEKYRVQPRFIVALWGIETDFGRVTGNFPVIELLATLAYDGRRSAFFRRELLFALLIIDEGHIGFNSMTGSWGWRHGPEPVHAIKLPEPCCRLQW